MHWQKFFPKYMDYRFFQNKMRPWFIAHRANQTSLFDTEELTTALSTLLHKQTWNLPRNQTLKWSNTNFVFNHHLPVKKNNSYKDKIRPWQFFFYTTIVVVHNNLSLSSADELQKAIKYAFPDYEIAQEYKCKQVLNSLGIELYMMISSSLKIHYISFCFLFIDHCCI